MDDIDWNAEFAELAADRLEAERDYQSYVYVCNSQPSPCPAREACTHPPPPRIRSKAG